MIYIFVGEQRGGVGHAVGFDTESNTNCSLLFVTAGWLLKKLAHNPHFFSTISHIIIILLYLIIILIDCYKILFWTRFMKGQWKLIC